MRRCPQLHGGAHETFNCSKKKVSSLAEREGVTIRAFMGLPTGARLREFKSWKGPSHVADGQRRLGR